MIVNILLKRKKKKKKIILIADFRIDLGLIVVEPNSSNTNNENYMLTIVFLFKRRPCEYRIFNI